MASSLDYLPFVTAGSALIGAVGGVAGLGWWLKSQFTNERERNDAKLEGQITGLRDTIDMLKSSIMQRFEQHERDDTHRFEQQNLAIMRLEIWKQREQDTPPGPTVSPYEA